MLIGYKALLIPTGWMVALAVIALSAWHDWKGERKPVRRWASIFFLLGALLMSTKVVRQISFHRELHLLNGADIAAIRVNGDLALGNSRGIVLALSGSTFLDPHDGGPMRSPVKLEILLRSGETYTYSVARYHDGASIISGSKEAFSAELAAALDRAGKPLPDWEKR